MGRCRRELAKILALILVATCLFQPGMAAHASVSDRDPASGSRQEQPAGEQPELASDSNASQKEEPEDIQEEPERDQDSDSDSRQDHPKGDRPEKATDSSASPEREPEDSPEGSYEHTGGAGKFELATISDAQMGIAPNSLIPPCEDVYVYLDLTEYPREELKEMKVDTILELLKEQNTVFTIQEGQKVILVSLGDIEDIYRVIEREDTLDLTEMQDAEFTMTLRVGTGNQLDYDAVQYIVTVTIAPETVTMIEDALTFELSRNRGEMGTTVFDKPNRVYMESHFSEDPAIPVTAVVFYVEDSVEGNYNVSISSTFRTQNNDISVNLYKMEDFLRLYREEEGTLDESEGLEWNVTISENPDPVGSEAVYCIAYFKDDKVIAFRGLTFAVHHDFSEIMGSLYAYEDGRMTNVTTTITGMNTALDWTIRPNEEKAYDSIEMDYQTVEYTLKDGYLREGTYYYVLDKGTTLAEEVEAGKIGGAAGMDEMENVTEQAIPAEKSQVPYGYKVDFGEGNRALKITLKDGNIFQHFIKIGSGTSSASYNPAPVRGVDEYFQLTGTTRYDVDYYLVLNRQDTTVDTYCGYGYQSMFLLDPNFELDNTQVTFSCTADKVCVGGVEQTSRETIQDFSSGEPVCYDVYIDGNVRKYQVRVVKQAKGPKLFVNGPSEREIFLDKYFGYEHSILIANIGDQNLTGLTVELNATHVKLDDYWTVGGAQNSMLEAFKEGSNNYKAKNVAKITLVPDGIGEISGTLRISADDQDTVEIKLTGYAGNLHIITETLGDAVKGERYSCQIEHSKLPDWNEVTFHLVEGKLPQGLHLDPKTGEISGTPEETGDFRIEVGASYSIDEFDESYAEYTLKVGYSSDDDEEIDPGDDEEIDSGDDEGSDSGDDEEIGSGGDSGSGSDSGSESGSDSGGSGSESGSGSGSRDYGSIIDTAGSGYTDDSWVWDGNGWKCKAPDGSVLANGWHQLPYKGSTDWYFFDGQGYMVTGWLTHEGQTYYLNPEADGNQGKMCTGWMYLDDTWYYFNEESDGTKGAMLTSGWHYLSYNGRMDWYYFDEKGKMLTGWITTDDERYYLNPVPDGTRGKMCTGWLMVDGKWYYFNEAPDGTRGAMAVNTWVDGRYVDGTGARAD